MLQAIMENWGTIATALFAVSEALSLIPGVKSNGIFQGIFNFLKDAAQPKTK